MTAESGRTLILGAKGMLGTDLADIVADMDPVLWDIEELDITNKGDVSKAFNEIKPAEVINCAAYTDVDGAESAPGTAMLVNGIAPGNIAAACKNIGARLIQISTDYVFDGTSESDYTENDLTIPLGAYGRSKLAGEQAILDSGCKFVILRTQWLYGRNGKNFVDTITRLAKERHRLTVVDDQVGKPTWTVELAGAIKRLLTTDARGVFHIACDGSCSWFDFAVEIVRNLSIDTTIEPVPTSAYPRPAERPARSVLNCRKIVELYGIRLSHWKAALRKYLETN
jgi:dTDP-4-dehydrorhamnose reductase